MEFNANFRQNPSSQHQLFCQNGRNWPSNTNCTHDFSFSHGSHKEIPIFGGFSINSPLIPCSFYDPNDLFQASRTNGIPKQSTTLNPYELDGSNGTMQECQFSSLFPQITCQFPKHFQINHELNTQVPQSIDSNSFNDEMNPSETKNNKWGKRKRQVKRESTYNKKRSAIKGQWTLEEDSKLTDLVRRYGVKQWTVIASMLEGRIGKQCRERWNNYLNPDLKKGEWTEEEEAKLVAAHMEVGNKWAEIGRRLPGRSENSIKNLWNATRRSQLYALGSGQMSINGRISPLQHYINGLIISNSSSSSSSSSSKGVAIPETNVMSDEVPQQDPVSEVDQWINSGVPNFPAFDEKDSWKGNGGAGCSSGADEADEELDKKQREMDFFQMLLDYN